MIPKFTIFVFLSICSLIFAGSVTQPPDSTYPIPIKPGTINRQGDLVRTETPTLSWRNVTNARYYEIRIGRQRFDGSFESIIGSKFNAIIFDTAYTLKPGVFDRNGLYNWSVRANFGEDWSPFSPDLFIKYESSKITRYVPEIITHQPEEIFVSVKYAGILKETIAGFYDRDKIFIPFIELFELLEINTEIDLKNKIISGFYIDRTNRYRLEVNNQRIYLDSASAYFTKDDFYATDFDFYFDVEFYKEAFGLILDFDLSNLAININSPRLLPLYVRLSRERTYSAIEREKELQLMKLHFGRERKIFNAGIFDYHFTHSINKNSKPSGLYRIGAAGELAGGDIQIYSRGFYNESKLSSDQTDWKWRYVFENKYINSFSAGNLEFNGLEFSNFDGVKISNEPVEPRREFATYKIMETTNPHWTVEVYINNNLLEVAKADATGKYSFDLPLNYGTTLVQKKYYGPTGEFYFENKLYQTPFILLQPEEFNYDVSYGRQRSTNYHLANVKSSYGFTEWLTNTLGIEYLQNSNRDRPVFYNSLTGRYTGSYLFNLMIAPDVFYKISANALYYSQIFLDLNFTNYVSRGYFNPANLNNRFDTQVFIPLHLESYQLNFRSSFEYTESDERKSYEAEFGSSASISSFNPAVNLRYSYYDLPGDNFESVFLDIGSTASVRVLTDWLPILRGSVFTFRSIYDFTNGEFSNLTAALSTGIFQNSRIQISHSKFFQSSTDLTQLQFVVYFPFTQYSGSINDISATQNLLGSVSYNAFNNDLHFYERQQIGRSAAAFRMFVDENANQMYDESERLLNDAWLTLGTSVVRRDGGGNIIARELNPYTTYSANILEESIKNPILVPKENKFSFTTDPNTVKQIDIPFYASGEISGTIYRAVDSVKSTVAGIKVHIESIEDNSVITVSTFSNGEYYHFGLKPGQYRIFVNKQHAESLGLSVHPSLRMVDVKALLNGDILDRVDFLLK